MSGAGNSTEGERLLQVSVRGARRTGTSAASRTRQGRSAAFALARQDYERARLLFEESLALHRTLDDPWGISHALSSLALVAAEARA